MSNYSSIFFKEKYTALIFVSQTCISLLFTFQEAAQRREQKKIEKKQMKMKQIKVKAMWKNNAGIKDEKQCSAQAVFSPAFLTSPQLWLSVTPALNRHPVPLGLSSLAVSITTCSVWCGSTLMTEWTVHVSREKDFCHHRICHYSSRQDFSFSFFFSVQLSF